MRKVATWKLIMLFVYSSTAIPACMFLFSLIVQWLAAPGMESDFFGAEQIRVSCRMAIVGFFLGILLWLFYYIPYKKRLSGR
ncbi:hypothetical protein [Rosenbergiella nectarea]|uniref:hypothetical protein n=1 Tax=Rosenbergiella nectarea TaxID=988801 RepID=UPI001F4F00F7|nr:hypothetical protein [Rosenbergiella nectarea]